LVRFEKFEDTHFRNGVIRNPSLEDSKDSKTLLKT